MLSCYTKYMLGGKGKISEQFLQTKNVHPNVFIDEE
jgi:hypothetical protein